MIVTLDGRRLDESFNPDCTLETVIEQVRRDHVGQRLVTSVRLNGQTLTDNDLKDGLATLLTSDAQVDLESGDRRELVRDALLGLALQFECDAEQSAEIAARLSAGEVADGVRQVGEFVQLWQTCYRTLVQCCDLLGEDMTAWEHDGRTMRSHLDELVGKLNELRDALDARDMVVLGDLIRYELPPLYANWHKLLAGVAEQVCITSVAD
jgi:hypothetical protein